MEQQLSTEALDAIKRVEKLLALARDARGNEHEAQNALDMAHQILEKHNLDMAVIESKKSTGVDGKRDDTRLKGGLYKWQRELWDYTSRLNFCVYYSIRGTAKGSTYENRVIGRPVNVVMTKMMAEYLQQTIERMAREWAEQRGLNIFCKDAVIYREGMADSISLRLWKLRDQRLKESQDRAARNSGNGTGRELALTDVASTEDDLNTDYLHGMPAGTTARNRATRVAEHEARKAEHERRMREDANYAKGYNDAQEKATAEWQERIKNYRASNRAYRETAQDRRRDTVAYRAGRQSGDAVGLDPQMTKKDEKLID